MKKYVVLVVSVDEISCHRERKRGDPLEKVRGMYSALYSKGLPQSLRSFAMTEKIQGVSVRRREKKYVILSVSEISHRTIAL